MEILRDLSAFWSMFHVIFLFVMLFRSRYTKKKTILLAVTAMGTLMLLNGVGIVVLGFELMGKIFLLTCSLPSFLFFYILSSDKKFRFLLTFCLADTSCLWIIAVTLLMDAYLGGGQYVIMFVSRLIAFPVMEYLAYRYLRKPYLELQDSVEKGWGVFAGMTLLYYLLLAVMIYYPSNIANRPGDVLPCVLVLILMFFNYATIFSSIYGQLLLYRKQQSERALQEQKASLEVKLENQQHIRKMKHDMKGHTVTISGLLAAGKTQEALKYLEQVETEMDALLGQFCANPYINAVFVHYDQKFQELGAECIMDIQIGGEEQPYMELCQILSNGLENAYNALKELEPAKRKISVQMKYKKKNLIIRMKNSCRDDLHVEKGSIPPTDKEGYEHGFGLPTIKEAAERLLGDMMCYTKDGSFVLEVMIRIQSL